MYETKQNIILSNAVALYLLFSPFYGGTSVQNLKISSYCGEYNMEK